MNKQEIRKLLEEVAPMGKACGNLPNRLDSVLGYCDGAKRKVGDFMVECEEIHGGNEGDGAEYWVVFSITDQANNPVAYVRINGSHNSWDGTEFYNDDFDIVVPDEVTVTQWKKEG